MGLARPRLVGGLGVAGAARCAGLALGLAGATRCVGLARPRLVGAMVLHWTHTNTS